MNRNFIFVLIILATLSTIDSIPSQFHKRATIFERCPEPPPLIVSGIVPDPLVPGQLGKFEFSGKIPTIVPMGSTLSAYFYNVDGGTAKLVGKISGEICTPNGIINCPYPANTLFSGELSDTVPA